MSDDVVVGYYYYDYCDCFYCHLIIIKLNPSNNATIITIIIEIEIILIIVMLICPILMVLFVLVEVEERVIGLLGFSCLSGNKY